MKFKMTVCVFVKYSQRRTGKENAKWRHDSCRSFTKKSPEQGQDQAEASAAQGADAGTSSPQGGASLGPAGRPASFNKEITFCDVSGAGGHCRQPYTILTAAYSCVASHLPCV